jgi:hypothetical protein
MTSIFNKIASRVLLVMILGVAPVHAEDPTVVMWDDLQPADNELDRLSRDQPQPPISHGGGQSAIPLQMAGEVVPELDGKRVKIPAYVVPLDGSREALTEMLLVPYFGACVHVPPPPPNQIIHIQDGEGVPIADLDLYNPVWATGVIRTEAISHEIAEIGYRMEVEELTVYDPRDNPRVKKQ